MSTTTYKLKDWKPGEALERFQFNDERVGFRSGQCSPVLRTRQHSARFVEPKNRYNGVVACSQNLQDGIRIGMCSAFEAPPHGDGIIEDKSHARP